MHGVDDGHPHAVVVWQPHNFGPAAAMLLEVLVAFFLRFELLPFACMLDMLLMRARRTAYSEQVSRYMHGMTGLHIPPRRELSVYISFVVTVPSVHGTSLWLLSAKPPTLHMAGWSVHAQMTTTRHRRPAECKISKCSVQ